MSGNAEDHNLGSFNRRRFTTFLAAKPLLVQQSGALKALGSVFQGTQETPWWAGYLGCSAAVQQSYDTLSNLAETDAGAIQLIKAQGKYAEAVCKLRKFAEEHGVTDESIGRQITAVLSDTAKRAIEKYEQDSSTAVLDGLKNGEYKAPSFDLNGVPESERDLALAVAKLNFVPDQLTAMDSVLDLGRILGWYMGNRTQYKTEIRVLRDIIKDLDIPENLKQLAFQDVADLERAFKSHANGKQEQDACNDQAPKENSGVQKTSKSAVPLSQDMKAYVGAVRTLGHKTWVDAHFDLGNGCLSPTKENGR